MKNVLPRFEKRMTPYNVLCFFESNVKAGDRLFLVDVAQLQAALQFFERLRKVKNLKA